MADALPNNRKWSLTEEAFDRFLHCLDEDRDRAGEKYEDIRGGLVRFFEWRGCPFSEDRADETINRVAKKLGLGEEFRDIYTYVYGVARLVRLEALRESSRERTALEALPHNQIPHEESEDSQTALECLKRCLERLSPENREMIEGYYQGEKSAKIEHRKRLAENLALPLNALRIRACRIREKLQVCVGSCVDRAK